jgi:hypothetical protein
MIRSTRLLSRATSTRTRLALALLTPCLLGLLSPGAAFAQARAVVAPATRDLGVVALGTEPVAEFTVTNAGDAPLEIEAHSVPKPLGVARVDSPIAPGGKGQVRLTIDTFRATTETAWKISFATNDPKQPFLEVTLKADVRQFLMVNPQSARFTFVQYGREGGTSHVLSAVDDGKMEVVGVDSPVPWIRAQVRELAEKERDPEQPGTRQWRIDLTILSDAPVGPIGGHVIIRTTHPSQPRAFLAVTGFVRPLFAVTPPTATLLQSPPSPGEPVATLHVKNFGAEDLQLTGATSDIAGLDARIVPVEAGHVWKVELRRPADAGTSAPAAGTVRLTTTHPTVKVIEVPIGPKRSGGQ